MNEYVYLLIILCAAIGSGLVAGIFFAFSSFVMTALSRLTDDQGIRAMQAINLAVLNPLFFLVFVGTAVLSCLLIIVSIIKWGEVGSLLCLLGSLLYIGGTFMFTIIYHVPLNERLAKVTPNSKEATEHWINYVSRWIMGNHLRTVTACGALVVFLLALRLIV